MLQVQNIEKYYGSKNNVTKALDRVSFNVEAGEFLAIPAQLHLHHRRGQRRENPPGRGERGRLVGK